jgi:hypothetical protein
MSDVFAPVRKEDNFIILKPYQLCFDSCNAQHVEFGKYGFFQQQSNL